MNSPGKDRSDAETSPGVRRRVVWPGRGGLAALVVVAFVLISDLLGWRYLRLPAQKLASVALDREVTLGAPFRIHLRRTLEAQVGRLSIASPAQFDTRPLIELSDIAGRLDWSTLVGARLHLPELSIGSGRITAIRHADGAANWRFGQPQARSEDPAQAEPGGGTIAIPSIEKASIGEVRFALDDAPNALVLDGTLTVSGSDGDAEALDVKADGRWRERAVGAEIRAPRILAIAGTGRAEALVARARLDDASLAFDGAIEDLFGADGISGSFELAGPSLGILSITPILILPDTPAFALKGRFAQREGRIEVDVASAAIGSSRLSADLVYDGANRPPRVTGEIKAERLVLQDLGPAIGGDGGGSDAGATRDAENVDKAEMSGPRDAQPGPSAAKAKAADSEAEAAGGKAGDKGSGGRELPDEPFDLRALRAMNADIALDLNELDLGTDMLRPLTALNGRLSLESGLLKLAGMQARLAGGSVSGETSLDASKRDGSAAWHAKLDWKQVDLKRWLKQSGGDYFVAGAFSGRTETDGNGISTAQLLGSMNGSVRGRIHGGSISHLVLEAVGLDIAQTLGVLFTDQKPLQLSCALLDVGIAKGRLASNMIVLNTTDTLLFVEGGVDLNRERLDLRLVPMPKDFSLLSLRSPLTLGGTFAAPSIGVEPAPLAMKAIASLVLGAVAPIAAILPWIDPAEAENSEGCAPAIRAVKEKTAELKQADGESGAEASGATGKAPEGARQASDATRSDQKSPQPDDDSRPRIGTRPPFIR